MRSRNSRSIKYKTGNRSRKTSRQKVKDNNKVSRLKNTLSSPSVYIATVEKNRRGFAFLVFDSARISDQFLSPRSARDYFHGDRVEVKFSDSKKIKSIKVIEHRFKEIFGRFNPEVIMAFRSKNTTYSGFVNYEYKFISESIYVPRAPSHLKAGDWVRIKLKFNEEADSEHEHLVTGEVVESFGQELAAKTDVLRIATEFNLKESHSSAAIKEAEKLKFEFLTNREDLTGVPFITIDGDDARDFDDAIFVERDGRGYTLWVAISDVGEYIKEDSALDCEAKERGCSVYFPERAFHMLPAFIAEGLCCLRPQETRLALVAKINFDEHAKRTDMDIFEAVIKCKRRATYNEIQKEYLSNINNKQWEFAPHFELYKLLKKMKQERGALDFDLPEASIELDKDCEPQKIEKLERFDSHKLIEEFMIAANEAVTNWVLIKDYPFIFRVHAEPDLMALERFGILARCFGLKIKVNSLKSVLGISKLLKSLSSNESEEILNMAMLRSLKQARYSAVHDIHYGLASTAYTHFTSPIRRYPDLIVHRILKSIINDTKVERNEEKKLHKKLEELAEHCSYRERIAMEAERSAKKLKQVRFVKKCLGNEYAGKIIGMNTAGFFVQVDTPFIEGFVSRETLNDDFYFNEDKMLFVGKRSGRKFKLGQILNIQAVRADTDRKEVEFLVTSDSA